MGITDWYKRWRHGHGFGVHSPYAYRLVRDVLRPGRGYAYYAYADIDRMLNGRRSATGRDAIYRVRAGENVPIDSQQHVGTRHSASLREVGPRITRDEARLIYRILVELAPRSVAIYAPEPLRRLLADIASLAGATVSRAQADMILAWDALDIPTDRPGYYTGHALAVVPATIPAGHIYRNPRRALLLPRPGLPSQTIHVNF